MTRDEMLKTIKEQYAELTTTLDGIPENILARGPLIGWWTTKDLLGHIVLWQQVALQFIAEFKRDGVPQPLGIKDDDDLDRYNKRGVALRRDLAYAVVRAELETTHRQLIAAIEALSDTDLTKPLPQPWGEGATLERLIAVNSYQHVPEHIEQIASIKTQG